MPSRRAADRFLWLTIPTSVWLERAGAMARVRQRDARSLHGIETRAAEGSARGARCLRLAGSRASSAAAAPSLCRASGR